MPKALTPEQVAERAMARREARQNKGKSSTVGRNPQVKGDSVREKTATGRDYTIRYGVLPVDEFQDYAIVWRHPGYSRPPAPTPNEGEHGSKNLRPPGGFPHLREFYARLKESAAREGIRNPVFALNYPDGLFVRYGCSRVWTAKQLRIEVPVIIADYHGSYEHLEELHTEEDIRRKYVDQPRLIELEQDYMRIDGCPQ